MLIKSPYLLTPGDDVHLHDLNSSDTAPFKDKNQALPLVEKNLAKLAGLQELLFAQSKHAVLVVFQAMDTGGKDGAISHIFRGVNPQGCQVTSFKVPSAEESAHDYLWRIHRAAPARGMIGIFNRSHYESVLVERVHRLVPKKTWKRRYAEINAFEEMLSNEGTLILKFFLHISKAQQKRRLEARLADKDKRWKFSPADVHERKYWNDYTDAYTDALERCSTDWAPWTIVPSDHKWFRNWVLSDTIVRSLEKLHLKVPKAPPGLDKLKID